VTLSAWARPSDQQDGWRTIIHRQTDAYFLVAGSERQTRYGIVDGVRFALLMAAVAWFSWSVGVGRRPAAPARIRSWWLPVLLFIFGAIADAVMVPTSTLIAPTLLAVWLTLTAPRRREAAMFGIAATVSLALTTASMADAGVVATALARGDGSVARSMAVGALFLLAGLAVAVAPTRRPPMTDGPVIVRAPDRLTPR
jgi:hypothetical protein